MTSLLEWRDGDTYRLNGELQVFTCTDGELEMRRNLQGDRSPAHPKLHEYKVQEIIRGLRLPLGRRYLARLGYDSTGLGAVSVAEEMVRGDLYELSYAAVACRLRNKGGGYAKEMMKDTLDIITARCVLLGSEEVEVYGYIHPNNGPSQRMCFDLGLRHEKDMDDGMQRWKQILPLEVDEP